MNTSLTISSTKKLIIWYKVKELFSSGMNYTKKLLYDQDKVLLHDENLGDLILTKGFRAFVSQQHFEVVFCRKSDSQSKGKIENAVKYIKYNFLRGRKFSGIDQLNSEAWRGLSARATARCTTASTVSHPRNLPLRNRTCNHITGPRNLRSLK